MAPGCSPGAEAERVAGRVLNYSSSFGLEVSKGALPPVPRPCGGAAAVCPLAVALVHRPRMLILDEPTSRVRSDRQGHLSGRKADRPVAPLDHVTNLPSRPTSSTKPSACEPHLSDASGPCAGKADTPAGPGEATADAAPGEGLHRSLEEASGRHRASLVLAAPTAVATHRATPIGKTQDSAATAGHYTRREGPWKLIRDPIRNQHGRARRPVLMVVMLRHQHGCREPALAVLDRDRQPRTSRELTPSTWPGRPISSKHCRR